MEKHKDVKIEDSEEGFLSIDAYNTAEDRFYTKKELQEIAHYLLDQEQFKDKIIFYDGCMSYNVKNTDD